MWSDFLPFGAFDTDSDPPLNAISPEGFNDPERPYCVRDYALGEKRVISILNSS